MVGVASCVRGGGDAAVRSFPELGCVTGIARGYRVFGGYAGMVSPGGGSLPGSSASCFAQIASTPPIYRGLSYRR